MSHLPEQLQTPRAPFDARRKRQRGSVYVYLFFALAALMGIGAWATETSRVWRVKNQLQAVADSAALAAVGGLFGSDFTTISAGAAQAAARDLADEHQILSTTINLNNADIQVGSWDMSTNTFTPIPGGTDPDEVRAVRVVARRDSKANGEVPTIFAGVFAATIYDGATDSGGAAIDPASVATIAVNSDAIAYWGYAGSADTGVVDLPIAVDCCAVSGDSGGSLCQANYCDEIAANPPNPCPLTTGPTATCLDFTSDPTQNACWTAFDGSDPTVDDITLIAQVNAGNTQSIGGPIYVGRSSRAPVVEEIKDRFEGRPPYTSPAGTDTSGDGNVDSWVVRLPIIECQNPGLSCNTPNPQTVSGFACFEVQEVLEAGALGVGSLASIRGRFLCSSDPRCVRDGLGPGGVIVGALSSQSPVIVE